MEDPMPTTQLVLVNVTLADAGIYACHVTNMFGDVNSSAILTIVQPTVASGLSPLPHIGVYSLIHMISDSREGDVSGLSRFSQISCL